jgi:alpha-L-rhamnosidase
MILDAQWIGHITDKVIGKGTKDMEDGSPACYFRKEFIIKEKIKKAELIVTSLGIYESYINGKKTDNFLFKPQWTDYNQTINYNKIDVTNFLNIGKNCIGIIVGDGWYCGKISIIGRQLYGTYPLELFLQLEIEYNDGKKEYIKSDNTFKADTGKIRQNDFQNGEYIDNRIESDNFSLTDFDDSNWSNVEILPSKSDRLKECKAPQITYHEELKAEFLYFDKNGKGIYDIGQNLAGNISAKIEAEENDKIIFRYGEILNEDGSLYTENLRSAKSTDIFIANGKGIEIFEPHFTFHGFRYIEVTKPVNVEIKSIIALACYSNLEETGSFNCNNSLINQIYKNALWGQKSNFIGLPTDCPQRDERMGWTGDSYAFCGSAMYNMDCQGFYKEYLFNIREAQRLDGAITDVVPYVPVVGSGNNGWGDVITELPFTYYKMYGDKEILENNYSNIKKWIEYQTKNSENYIRPPFGYGDWLSIIINEANVECTNTAFFAYSVKTAEKIALILEKKEDAEEYAILFKKIKESFRNKFINIDKTLGNNSQGEYLLAYNFGLMSKEEIKDNFIKSVHKVNNHLSCGFMSIKYLLPTLCELNESDLAYELISKDTYPSWGYSIRQGATTIWERWNSYTIENGFGNADMNSFNHYSFGSCVEWMYRYMLGINCLESDAGFKKLLIRPFIDFSGIINRCEGVYKSINGDIAVKWIVESDICTYNLQVDKNIKIMYDFGELNIISENIQKDKITIILKK